MAGAAATVAAAGAAPGVAEAAAAGAAGRASAVAPVARPIARRRGLRGDGEIRRPFRIAPHIAVHAYRGSRGAGEWKGSG
ncbi:hypothetical protein GCM10009678_48740 [Actinomadura kijaniata]